MNQRFQASAQPLRRLDGRPPGGRPLCRGRAEAAGSLYRAHQALYLTDTGFGSHRANRAHVLCDPGSLVESALIQGVFTQPLNARLARSFCAMLRCSSLK